MNKPIPFGKYYLLDRINTGGMAEVFRAKAFGVEGFERLVAVKRILPTIAEDVDFITMFIDEAKIAVQLNHANIAQIFDLGKVGESYFIALEYVHGRDLRALYDLCVSLGQPMPVAMASYIIMKVCEGLDYAHNKRDASGRDLELVHRDVSPQNILISYDGEVKLIDFGIAKAAGKAGRTQAGILKGKFGYLSPEQVEGEEIDRRSDLFGVGIVLYELLTNQRLFAGDSDFSTIEKVRNVDVPRPSIYNKSVPGALEAIVLKALARDRAVRFQTAMELHDELQKFLYARGEPFARRELTAWMRKRFAEQISGDHQVAGDRENESTQAERTDVAPILEPAESKAVITETRDAPEEGKAKKSTILGMPAVLPPPPEAKGGRTVPPPPPRGNTAPPGRSVPPPPPRTLPPGVMAGVTPSSPIPAVTPPSINAIPSVAQARISATPPPPTGRTMPPPPPSPAPTSQLPTPVNGASMMTAQSIALEQGNTPQNPVLDMDWDDEELSTQIYDRPEDQAGMDPYEAVEAGFEELRSQGGAGGQSGVPTYVPPSVGYGSPSAGYGSNPGYAGTPAMQVSASAFSVPMDPPAPPPSLSQPPLGSRAAQVTQPMSTHQAGSNRSPLYAALAVAAVVLLCFVGYVFLVKTERGVVQLTTHPTDATVLFDGKQVGATSPFLVTGVVAGEKHVLEVQKQGYRSWSQEVQVQPGQTLQFPVTLQPETPTAEPSQVAASAQAPTAPAATGGFSLETTPPGARVLLDGNPLEGATPMRVANLVAKKYSVRIEMPEFTAQTLDVEVRSGVDQTLPRVTLQPERVRVRITSEPGAAEAVVVRGDERRALGKTPLDVTLENNGTPWTLEVARSGFEPFRRELGVQNGEKELAVQAVLVRAGAAPSRSSHSEARAAKESAPVAAAPAPAPVAAATATPSGDADSLLRDLATKEVKEPPAKKEHVEPVASSGGGNGTLRINSKPWSQVFIDGKLIGNTPQMNVSLPEGSHRVTLVNPEFSLKKSVTITIKPGQTETQIINLQ